MSAIRDITDQLSSDRFADVYRRELARLRDEASSSPRSVETKSAVEHTQDRYSEGATKSTTTAARLAC